MKIINIEIKFKDSKKISFNLENNILLHGMNGGGKTRVLNTLVFLHQFCTSNDEFIIRRISDLNIETLKINEKPFDSLMSTTKKIRENTGDEENRFLIENKNEFEELYNIIRINIRYYEDFMSQNHIRRFKNFDRFYHEHISNTDAKLSSVSLWCRDAEMFINFFEETQKEAKSHILGEELFDFNISNNMIHDSTRYAKILVRNMQDDITVFRRNRQSHIASNLSQKVELQKEISSIKEKLKNMTILFLDTARTYDSDSTTILNRETTNINNQIIKGLWEYNTITDINIIKDFRLLIENLNRLISRYFDFEYFYDFKSQEWAMRKNGESITYSKLSSGEKNIVTMFTEIQFSKAQVIMIDEPEISLSLDYQNKIVFDLFKLCGNKKVIVATHAPYIYDDFSSFDNTSIIQLEAKQ